MLGCCTGHLVLVVTTMPHPTFTRNGNDLEMTHSITLSEVQCVDMQQAVNALCLLTHGRVACALQALVGFRHTLTHLDGHSFTLARSGVTKPGVGWALLCLWSAVPSQSER